MRRFGLFCLGSTLAVLSALATSLAFSQSSDMGAAAPKALAPRLDISDQEIMLTVPLTHPVEKVTIVRAQMELLDPRDRIRARETNELTLQPEERELVIKLKKPFVNVSREEMKTAPWLRIKYEARIVDGPLLASGIEALHGPGTALFSITAAAARIAEQGRLYQVRVHARAEDGRPLAGVRIAAEISWDDDSEDQKLEAAAVTNAAGDSTMQFSIPEAVHAESGDLKVQATRGVIIRSVEQSIYFQPAGYVLIETDKNIYQPGQTLHARILRFDAKRKSAEKENLDVRIVDQESTLVLRQTVTTDAFGVAHLDWAISQNTKLGDYRIRVADPNDEDASRWWWADTSVHIYRYDLPNFRVTAKPDRAYYLYGQNAEIKVSAEYLFGKPVTRGKVRVVEEEQRTWNFRTQKWDIEEGQVQSGEVDRDGTFTARFDLASHHEDLKDESQAKFRDIALAAYVTDLSTGRTEQRRFMLRVSREPIHVYASRATDAAEDLPPTYYISAFYADGTPARCKVQLSSYDSRAKVPQRHHLRTAETNRYGLARVEDLKIPSEDDDYLVAEAVDRKGLAGQNEESLNDYGESLLAVKTSRAIHRPGDPIEVSLRSHSSNLRVIVEAMRDGAVLATQRATLRNGRAYLVFPYEERFSDEINIVAYSLDHGDDRNAVGTETVLYPKNRRLGVDVQLDKDEHRPGEDARVRFAVHRPDQTSGETALGVKIVDTAVEERARTDEDFGRGRSWDWWRWSLWSSDSNAGFGGVSRDDLDQIDLTQPVPDDLDLVAKYILNSGWRRPMELMDDGSNSSAQAAFSGLMGSELRPLEYGLGDWIISGKIPRTQNDLVMLGKDHGFDVLNLNDPWATPYKFLIGFSGSNLVLTAVSAGPDKKFGTSDDLAWTTQRRYFAYYGNLIEQASQSLMQREGRFIRDRDTLQAEMLKLGVDFNSLRDPWDQPYEVNFPISDSFYLTQIVSHGDPAAVNARVVVWESKVDYFLQARDQINRMLTAHLRRGGAYPGTEQDFKDILRDAGIDLDRLRDPWGSPYYVVFSEGSRYGDRVTITQSSASGQRTSDPVTLSQRHLRLMSAGMDRRPGSNDDFQVASYTVLLSEKRAVGSVEVPRLASAVNLTGNTGAITGTVTDPQGAVVAGADVQVTREGSGERFQTKTDGSGIFMFRDLTPGTYTILASARGFQSVTAAAVPVQALQVTELNLVLSVGSTTETVEVTAAAPLVETTQAQVSSVVGTRRPTTGKAAEVAKASVMSTPRLRQDFPETMLWEPSLITDTRGRANLNFKMADNITTWKLTAVASTKNGELGRVEKDLRAFQPFFIEHDPPRILTQGDEIAYPVVLRNYLDRPQELKASIKPEAWFALLGSAEVAVRVDAGDSARAVFRYKATNAVLNGKQQATAANARISDAVEKPIDVHPFGRPGSVTASGLMDKQGTLELHVPEDAIAGSLRARVKVYPNLLAHVAENLEAGLEQPHGCGEQTISSTFPSLLVTELFADSPEKPAVARKAERYLAAGYERLLGYQDPSGGFSYWGRGDPDLSLTAYAIEFLNRASRYTPVDADVTQRSEQWIIRQQSPDGAWRHRWNRDDKDALLETAYIAEILSSLSSVSDKAANPRAPALKKALGFLTAHRDLMDEPYVIAGYALAANSAGDEKLAAELIAVLRSGAHYENHAAYWLLEHNTPFYAWGRTGRLESTALVLRALATVKTPSAGDKELLRQGLLFLLRNEDKDGMWYSGQTTVQVLKTLLSMVAERGSAAKETLTVRVNQQPAAKLDLPQGRTVAAPLEVDVSAYVKAGDNRVQLETASEGMMSVQFVVDSYVPWKDETVATSAKNSSSALTFRVTYSNDHPTEGETVDCRVHAERVGYRGYGMMLGEVGLPPGADVDRESLESALRGNYFLYQYDVLPDRVILYLWPQAGGSDLAFRLRPRFAMHAVTAPSILYDYYNPDVSVTLKPVRFEVKAGAEDK